MTKVLMEFADGRYRIICDGHAIGNQDVCAAVSTLVCTAAIWLDAHPGLMVRVSVAEGHAELEFKDRKLYEFLCAGLNGLIDSYPENISLYGD